MSYKIRMGGPETTDEVVAGLGFSANPLITQENFPLAPSELREDEIEIVDPGCEFTEEEGLQILRDHGLGRPDYAHGIHFAGQHGEGAAFENVVFLHEPWQDRDGAPRVLSLLSEGVVFHRFGLLRTSDPFLAGSVIAGVRPR